jgi:hypothetical protein
MNYYVGDLYYNKYSKTLSKVTQVGQRTIWFNSYIDVLHKYTFRSPGIGYMRTEIDALISNNSIIKVSKDMANILYG